MYNAEVSDSLSDYPDVTLTSEQIAQIAGPRKLSAEWTTEDVQEFRELWGAAPLMTQLELFTDV